MPAARDGFVHARVVHRDPCSCGVVSSKGADARAERLPKTAPQLRQFNTVPDNVAYTMAAGVLANESTGYAPFLRPRLAGTAPGKGAAYLRFPSNAFPFSRSDSRFVIRACWSGEPERRGDAR